MSALKAYRRDIDGLRAVAVLAVVAFHFGLSMPGGFVGVDVFFVISGYLIGSQLYRASLNGTFSWRSFYAKRARRIMPALLATLLATYAAMLIVATPGELEAFGRDAIATLLSVSNVTLWRSIDYFNPTADLNPLLMTWSLSVEEQFYIVAPFLILLLTRLRPGYRLMTLAALLGASLALAVWGVQQRPSATFYLLPTRAWELGAGVLLGMVKSHRLPVSRPSGHSSCHNPGRKGISLELRALAGLLLILVPAMLYTRETPFPGLAALPPVLGAVLLLDTEGAFINRRLLSCAPMRFFGFISYSLYLWHWPVISMTHLVLEKPPGLLLRLVLTLVSIGLAWLSYRFIETPFRHGKTTEGRTLARYGAAMGAVALVTGTALVAQGLPQRWPAGLVQMDRRASGYAPSCLANYGETDLNTSPECMPKTSESRGAVALVGDSHAAALAPGLYRRVEALDRDFVIMTKSSCAFLDGVSRAPSGHPTHFAECARYNERAIAHLVDTPRIRTVIIAGYWEAGLETGAGGYRRVREEAQNHAASSHLRKGLEQAVDRLQQSGKRVIVVRDVPLVNFSPIKRLATCASPARARLNGRHADDGDCGVIAPDEWHADHIADEIIDSVAAQRPHLRVEDPREYLCQDGYCRIADRERIFYADHQHLSAEGARVATQWFNETSLYQELSATHTSAYSDAAIDGRWR